MDNTLGVEAAREEGGVALIWSAAAAAERERGWRRAVMPR